MQGMNTASEIVTALGGTVAVANALDLTPSTVSSWKTSGSIPRWWMPGLEAFAREQGIDLPDRPAKTEGQAA
jgi:hypothetical protein